MLSATVDSNTQDNILIYQTSCKENKENTSLLLTGVTQVVSSLLLPGAEFIMNHHQYYFIPSVSEYAAPHFSITET